MTISLFIVIVFSITGCTPLHYSAANGYLHVSKYLIEEGHANLKFKSKKGQTPEHMAKCRGQLRVMRFLSQYGGYKRCWGHSENLSFYSDLQMSKSTHSSRNIQFVNLNIVCFFCCL